MGEQSGLDLTNPAPVTLILCNARGSNWPIADAPLDVSRGSFRG
jgi:hypothetical protein